MRYIKNAIAIRQLTAKDRALSSGAIALLNRTQGEGMFGADYLDERFQNQDAYIVAALRDDELVGIGIAEMITNFDYYKPFSPDIALELQGKSVASFTTLSIRETYQGRGIGLALGRKRLEWLAEQKCDVVLGVSWISGLKHTSSGTFEGLGFHPQKTLNDFYVKSSLEKPFDCPGCREIPCSCGAILYRLNFKNRNSTGTT